MRIALDTNILAYAEGIGDDERCNKAVSLIENLPSSLVLLPAQTLGELFRVLNKKAKRNSEEIRDAILNWADSFDIMDSTWSSFQAAFDLSTFHKLQIWDALILSVAAENRCRFLLSEDFQNGFTWKGVTIVNPFVRPLNPVFKSILSDIND
ncbi:PIN domain-containing protein [bacterium]|nr:PIN domain-containing protein [bacterium]